MKGNEYGDGGGHEHGLSILYRRQVDSVSWSDEKMGLHINIASQKYKNIGKNIDTDKI